MTKAVQEWALEQEFTEDFGYEKAGRGSGNSRKGARAKSLLTEVGGVELEVPRSQRLLRCRTRDRRNRTDSAQE